MEMARVDAMSLTTLSSLGWCLAAMKGQNPDENEVIRKEMNRASEVQKRFEELEKKKLAAEKAAAKRSFKIPEDADWDLSDVTLLTLNSNGKELYANKEFLSKYSLFFRSIFASDFKEADEKATKLECDFAVVREVLRILHQVDTDFGPHCLQDYDLNQLMFLLKTADVFDFPVVRELCDAHMATLPPVNVANAAHSLGLHDKLMEILFNMDAGEVEAFLSIKNVKNLGRQMIFSKGDVAAIYEKTKGRKLPENPHAVEEKKPLILEELLKQVEEDRKSENDVSLITKNCVGKVIYTEKEVLSSLSPYFHKIFYENHKTTQEESNLVIKIDTEYATVKQMLSIVQKRNNGGAAAGSRAASKIHPVLIYDMYVASSEDQLDIPMIKKFCHDQIVYQTSRNSIYPQMTSFFDVAAKLGIGDVKAKLVKGLPSDRLRDWLLSEKLSYFCDGQETVIMDAHEKLFSVDDLRAIYRHLVNGFG